MPLIEVVSANYLTALVASAAKERLIQIDEAATS
jgi:hypothetical protein